MTHVRQARGSVALYITDVPAPRTICGFRCRILFLCTASFTQSWHFSLMCKEAQPTQRCSLTCCPWVKRAGKRSCIPACMIQTKDTIWPVISSRALEVCLWVGMGATPWQQPRSILSTGTPGFDMQLLLAEEGNWFVCSVCGQWCLHRFQKLIYTQTPDERSLDLFILWAHRESNCNKII